MSRSIGDTVPKLLQTLWELEKELRGAARNGVVLRKDEARRHLSVARLHLNALLDLTQDARPSKISEHEKSDDSLTPTTIKH